MDFLKSAVASAISKSSSLPFNLEDRIDLDQSCWSLHNATRREDGSKCSVFTFDLNNNRSRIPLARNALRKLRTLRHPGVIKVLDTVENDTSICIVTERVMPLGWQIKRKSLAEETSKWGLFGIAKTLKFVNDEASSVHGNVRASSIFTSESGEWKLGGFDVLSSVKEDDAVIYSYGSQTIDSARYAPPEVAKVGWDSIKKNPLPAIDAYGYGILIYEVFNGSFTTADQLVQPRSVPPSMQQNYKRLIAANPKSRISVAQFIDHGQRSSGFFNTPLIHLTEGMDNLGLKNEAEREEFLSSLDDLADDFPEDFFKMKVLPELLKSVEFGGGGPRVLGVIMKIGQKLSDDEFEGSINPVIIRLFQSQDRAMRVALLENLPMMIDHFSQKIVNNTIFPQMVMGFSDVVPVVREQTVRAVLVVATKLSDRTLNGELLRHLAKTANDEQPGIRTNTTICLGKLARNLAAGSRAKVLSAAFARALRDPFVHARHAALLALAATADVFSEEECASKMLPGICPSLVDKEKLVRDQANKTLDIYLQRIKKYSSTMADSVLPPPGQANTSAGATVTAGQTDAAGWAGWAISSFTNKITSASGQMSATTNSSAAMSENRSHSVPPVASLPKPSAPLTRPSRLHPSASTTNVPSSKPLASPAPSSQVSTDDIADDFDTGWGDSAWDDGAAANDDAGDPWGNDEVDPFAAPTTTATISTTNDKGEPDFAAWLSAKESQKKQSSLPGKTLPKGLTKPATVSRTISSKPAAPLKTVSQTKVAPVKKPIVPVKKAEEEDEGWGDAWD